jgi:hypothetical protein
LRLRSVPWIEDELQAWMHELETRLLHPNPGRGLAGRGATTPATLAFADGRRLVRWLSGSPKTHGNRSPRPRRPGDRALRLTRTHRKFTRRGSNVPGSARATAARVNFLQYPDPSPRRRCGRTRKGAI